MSLLFNMLSRLVTAFLPRSKHLLISLHFSKQRLEKAAKGLDANNDHVCPKLGSLRWCLGHKMLIRHLTPMKGSRRKSSVRQRKKLNFTVLAKPHSTLRGNSGRRTARQGVLYGASHSTGLPWEGPGLGGGSSLDGAAPRCQLLATLCGWVAHLLISERWTCDSL